MIKFLAKPSLFVSPLACQQEIIEKEIKWNKCKRITNIFDLFLLQREIRYHLLKHPGMRTQKQRDFCTAYLITSKNTNSYKV